MSAYEFHIAHLLAHSNDLEHRSEEVFNRIDCALAKAHLAIARADEFLKESAFQIKRTESASPRLFRHAGKLTQFVKLPWRRKTATMRSETYKCRE